MTLLANKEGLDLTGLARDIADAYKAGLGAGVSSDAIVTRESKFSVDETVARLEKLLGGAKDSDFRHVRPRRQCAARRHATAADQSSRLWESQGRHEADAEQPVGRARPATAPVDMGG